MLTSTTFRGRHDKLRLRKGDKAMTTIRIYDDTAKIIEELAEKHNMTEAEVIDYIITGLDENELDNLLD